MSKRATLLMFLILLTAIAFAQANILDTVKTKKVILKSCQKPFENKALTLCRIQADTITYEQLKNCNEFVINNNKKQQIDSYLLSFMLPDSTSIKEYKGTGSKIPMAAVDAIIFSKIDKILVEEVYGTESSEYIILGHRWFYFK